MAWRNRKLSTYSRYNVDVGTNKIEESSLLTPKKGKSVGHNIVNKITATLAIIMLFVVGFSGLMANSQEARAWGPLDGVWNEAQNAFCATAPYGYGVEDKGVLSAKNAKGATNTTAYEKYGMSGTKWTVWSGFVPEKGGKMDENDGNGQGTTRGIINMIGGDSRDKAANMIQWQKEFEGKESSYPGVFNFNGECGGLSLRMAGTMGANFTFSASKIVTWVSGYVYQVAADVNERIYNVMEKPVNDIVKALKSKLYFAYLTPMVMIAALWMGWVGLVKRQTTQVFSGLVWLIASVAVSVAIMTNPMAVPKTMNNIVSGVSESAMATITSTNPGQDALCKATGKNKSSNAVRAVQCNLWYSFVYTPFTVGQFGSSPQDLAKAERNAKEGDKSDARNSFLERSKKGNNKFVYDGQGRAKLNTLNDVHGGQMEITKVKLGNKVVDNSQQNWALSWIDFKSNWDNAQPSQKYNKARALVGISMNQLARGEYNADFRGDKSDNRFVLAITSFVSSLSSGAMILVLSVTLIVLDLGIIILTLIAPVFCLAALHPGAGRRLAMGWVEMLMKLGLRRIVGSVYLATLVMVFSILSNSSTDWTLGMVLTIAIAVAGLVYYKKVDGAFNNFSLGGQQMNVPGTGTGSRMMNRLGQGVKGNSAALLTGGLAGKNSMLGRSIAENRNDKRWAKRMGDGSSNGGAGRAPQGQNAPPSDRDEARRRTLGLASGAGAQPEVGNENQEYGSPQHEGGAGEAPQEQLDNQYREDEILGENQQIPRGELPDEESENMDSVGAGKAPMSYSEQLKAHPRYKPTIQERGTARLAGMGRGFSSVAGGTVRGYAQFGKDYLNAKASIASENIREKRIAKAHYELANSHALRGAGTRPTRAEAEAYVQQKSDDARARRERLIAPVHRVTRPVQNAAKSVAESRAMDATRRRLQDTATAAKNKTVVPYRENRAANRLMNLHEKDIRKENKDDRKSYRAERRIIRDDIKAQPKALRSDYAQETYGSTVRGKALEGHSAAAEATKPYVKPAIRRAQNEQNERGSGSSAKPVNAPRENAPRQSAPPVNAPRENTPRQSAPQVNAPRERAPRQSAPQVNTPRQSAPSPSLPPRGDRQKPSSEGTKPPKEVKQQNPSPPKKVSQKAPELPPRSQKGAPPIAPRSSNKDNTSKSPQKRNPLDRK